ncbi:MAG: hypothetical protein EKK64_05755 [Neisseriaceae bacterium]|jgi:hypothetical protein|nr:MAG: hypothetical protein EKK64_05755 [Neisseriaceae bacterium]
MNFFEFVNRKQRESIKHLKLIKKMLEQSNVKVNDFLDDENPYIFVKNPLKDRLEFEGIRIYQIGEMIAYRVQREKDTEPYGKSYLLDLEEMFNDFMSENVEEEKAGEMVINGVIEELKKFFEKSADAENKIQDRDPGVIMPSVVTGTNYGGSVFNKYV